MLKRALVVPLLAALLALASAYAWSIANRRADLLLVQALHGAAAPVRAAAAFGLRRFGHCRNEHFAPSTAIGLLVAAADEHVPLPRVREVLAQLQALGCDIDKRGDHGLAPLHSAILLKRADAIQLLLHSGADPGVRTRFTDESGGGAYDAPTFAARLADTGGPEYAAIIALFAGAERSTPPP